MLSLPLLEAFLESCRAELNAAAREAEAQREQLARRADAVARKLAGVLQAIEDGLYTPALKERLMALEAEKAAIAEALKDEAPAAPVRLHPNLARVTLRRSPSSRPL